MKYLDNQIGKNQTKLVVSDLFDKTKYDKEFSLNLSPVANPISVLQKIEFINDKELEVSYLSGEIIKKKQKILY